MSAVHCKSKFYEDFYVFKGYLYIPSFVYIFLSASFFAVCDETDTNISLANDTYANITILFQNITDFDISNETKISNVNNFSAATELESPISVTEDSDNPFQIESSSKLLMFLTPDKDICNCDLTTNACDINCCCDPDCTEEDMQIFSDCSHQVLVPDESYCYQEDIILRNNTVYKMVKNPANSMFCIVHDNFKHHLRYKDMPLLKSHRDLTSVLKYKYKSTYSWNTESPTVLDSVEMRDGNPIFIDVKSAKETVTSKWGMYKFKRKYFDYISFLFLKFVYIYKILDHFRLGIGCTFKFCTLVHCIY